MDFNNQMCSVVTEIPFLLTLSSFFCNHVEKALGDNPVSVGLGKSLDLK